MYLRITTKKYKGETYHYAFLFDSEVVDGKKKPVMKANLGAVTEEQIPYLKAAYVGNYSTCCLAKMYEQSDRNIRKVRATILRKIHKKLIPVLQYKCDNGLSTTMKERNFLERHCSTDG